MGETPPSTVELICPGCGAYFRLKPKKGKLPKGPIPCPKCGTSIPVELASKQAPDNVGPEETQGYDPAQDPDPSEKPEAPKVAEEPKPKSPPMSGIISRPRKSTRSSSPAMPKPDASSAPAETNPRAQVEEPAISDQAPTVDKHRAALEALLDEDKGPNSTFLGFGLTKKGDGKQDKTAAIDEEVLKQVRSSSTKQTGENIAVDSPEEKRSKHGSTTDTSHFMRSDAEEVEHATEEMSPEAVAQDLREEARGIAERETPIQLEKLSFKEEAPSKETPSESKGDDWSQENAPGPFDLRDILEAEKEQIGSELSNEVTRNPALDADNPVGEPSSGSGPKPLPQDPFAQIPEADEAGSAQEMTVVREVADVKETTPNSARADVLGRLKKSLRSTPATSEDKEEDPAEALAARLERLERGELGSLAIESSEPPPERETQENAKVTAEQIEKEKSQPELQTSPAVSASEIFEESSAVQEDAAPIPAEEDDEPEQASSSAKTPLAALLKRKLGKAGYDDLKEKVEGSSEAYDESMSEVSSSSAEGEDSDELADLLSGADEDDLARVLDEAGDLSTWPKSPASATPSTTAQTTPRSAKTDEVADSEGGEPPRAKTKLGGFAAIKIPTHKDGIKDAQGQDEQPEEEEEAERPTPQAPKPRLSLSQKRDKARSLLRSLDSKGGAGEEEQDADDSQEAPSGLSWGDAALHRGDISNFGRKRRRQESHSGLFPITGGLGQESSVGMASEKRGSGYIRLPTAEILDVLGTGQYRLMVEDIVYEPVDEVGLTELVKRGVLMGAELIAEQGGEWIPIVEHPVFKRLRKKMALEAHALLAKYQADKSQEFSTVAAPVTEGSIESIEPDAEDMSDALVSEPEIELPPELPADVSGEVDAAAEDDDKDELLPSPMLSLPDAPKLREDEGEDEPLLSPEAAAENALEEDSSEQEEDPIDAPFPKELMSEVEDGPSISFELPVYKDPPAEEDSEDLFEESDSDVEESDEGLGQIEAPDDLAAQPAVQIQTPSLGGDEAVEIDDPFAPDPKPRVPIWAVLLVIALIGVGLVGAALAMNPELRSTVLGPVGLAGEGKETKDPTETTPKPELKPGEAIEAARAKLIDAATSFDFNDPTTLLGLAKEAKAEQSLALYRAAWSPAADPAATLAYAQSLAAAEKWGDLRGVVGAIAPGNNADIDALRAKAIDNDPAMRGFIHEPIEEGLHGDSMKVLPGRQVAFVLSNEDEQKTWVFQPEQSRYGRSDYTRDVVAWRLCQLITCNIHVPETMPARIDEATFNTMLSRGQGSGAASPSERYSRLDWKSEGEGDKKVRYVEGVLRRWNEPGPAFDMNYTKTWRGWVDASLDAAQLDEPLEKSLEGVKGENEELYKQLMAQKGELTTREFGRQISSMVVLDYMLNNRDRFRERQTYNGVDNQLVDGQIVSYDHTSALDSRLSSRVKGRLSWVTRLSKSQVESIRNLDKEKADAVLFPKEADVSSSDQRAFWSRHGKLVDEIEKREQRYGKENALAFE